MARKGFTLVAAIPGEKICVLPGQMVGQVTLLVR
jgi:hypothetical protein